MPAIVDSTKPYSGFEPDELAQSSSEAGALFQKLERKKIESTAAPTKMKKLELFVIFRFLNSQISHEDFLAFSFETLKTVIVNFKKPEDHSSRQTALLIG